MPMNIEHSNKKVLLPKIDLCYGSLNSMLKKYDTFARQDYFKGKTAIEFQHWKKEMRLLLHKLLGLNKMELCDLKPVNEDIHRVEGPMQIQRVHLRIQVEPGVWMPVYILIPEVLDPSNLIFLCPPGHNGAGKYSVAGFRRYEAVAEKIDFYHYDYGYQLAQLGYIAICPDCRGFGERREDLADARDIQTALKGDCSRLSHMGEPLGIPVIGLLTWDLMRMIDYIEQCEEWSQKKICCLGFSGGGMQTLWLSALDDRISLAVISGYLYGYRDSLLNLNQNCSCNYVPNLWEHLDMGDIASLIAPRPLLIQSCREDRLNGPRGMISVMEQIHIIRHAYQLFEASDRLLHDICEGTHQWHEENLQKNLKDLYPFINV